MEKGLVEQFSQLFRGYENAHGVYSTKGIEPAEDGKLTGKGKTILKPVSRLEIDTHLGGGDPAIGIVPLLSNNRVVWGCIDIDIKGDTKLREKIESLESKVRELGLPLVVCESKSKGAHLYCFAKDEMPAKVMQAKLAEFAAMLGYGGCEVFPKQTSRADEKDIGNWLNICYHGQTRTCISQGKRLDLQSFLAFAEKMKVSELQLHSIVPPTSDMFEDGPPCLQQLCASGGFSSFRNNAIFSVAVYYKRKSPDDWQDKVLEFNYKYMEPALPSGEVSIILKGLMKKTYNYKCKEDPIVRLCNRNKCLRREYGVASGDEMEGASIPLEGLTKCQSADSVKWYLQIAGERLQLSTEQLLDQASMQRIILERLNVMITPIKPNKWNKKIQDLLVTMEVQEDPEDASKTGQTDKLFESFFLNTRAARNADELVKGNWLLEAGRMYFRSEDVMNYLGAKKVAISAHDLWMFLKNNRAAESTRIMVKGKRTRVWSIPQFELYSEEPLEVPEFQNQVESI